MIIRLFTHWHKKLKCCSQIEFDDHEPQVRATNLKRACLSAKLDEFKQAKALTKYLYLGEFDDETCKFNILSEPEVLLDFDEIIEEREVFEKSVQLETEKKEEVA